MTEANGHLSRRWPRVAGAAHRLVALAGTIPWGESVTPILCYHSIDGRGRPTSTPLESFEGQMRRLRVLGYRTMAFGALVKDLKSGQPLPAKSIALTFDDGFRSVKELAIPVLAELEFCAGIAVVTGLCDRQLEPSAIGVEAKADDFLSRGEVRSLAESGVEILSHSASHRRLPALSDADLWEEVAGSKSRLEDLTGRPVDFFVYPFGAYDDRVVAAAARAGYRGACTIDPGTVRSGADVFRLRRTCFRWDTTDEFFSAALSVAFDAYVIAGTHVRSAVDRIQSRRDPIEIVSDGREKAR